MPPCPLGSPAMAALLLVGLLMIPRAGECAGVSHRVSVFIYDAFSGNAGTHCQTSFDVVITTLSLCLMSDGNQP